MDPLKRARFDKLLESVLNSLHNRIHRLLEEVPLVVEDTPAPELLEELNCAPDEICGLYSGLMLTERSIDDLPSLPDTIYLYREGILAIAGGWDTWNDEEDGTPMGGDDVIREEIRITILHEVGHHFGLEEDDLEALGYA
ncbi:MAG: metallopeptidase family protein [Phycisphaerales bacterium]|nr:metallopeptidase family protein [Phycisphaerales bacterium]